MFLFITKKSCAHQNEIGGKSWKAGEAVCVAKKNGLLVLGMCHFHKNCGNLVVIVTVIVPHINLRKAACSHLYLLTVEKSLLIPSKLKMMHHR